MDLKRETGQGDLQIKHAMVTGSPASSLKLNIKEEPAIREELVRLEATIRRKLDWHLLPLCILIHLSAQIDRSNMGNARIMGMASDIQLTGNRFNIALTAFFCTYVVFEVPSNMLCKVFGSRIWLAVLTTGFGLITMCIAFVESYAALIACRVILGIFEAGIIPGLVFTLSQYYRRHEMAARIGIQSAMGSLSGSFGGLLASGLASIPRCGILHTWRYIFLIEGLLTIFLGICVALFFPNKLSGGPSFLTNDECRVAIERLQEEHRIKANEPFDRMTFVRAFSHPATHLVGIALLCSLLCMNSIGLFMPTLLHSMGFSQIQSQLLTVPPYAVAAIFCITTAIISDKIKRRGIILLFLLPCIVTGFAILAGVESVGVRYFAIYLATIGGYCSSPLLLTWSVDNAAGSAVRAVVSGYAVGLGNVGSIISTWTYVKSDAPRYVHGHILNCAFGTLCFLVVITLMSYLTWENRRRRQGRRNYRLEGLTEEEVERLGHQHPNFKFTL